MSFCEIGPQINWFLIDVNRTWYINAIWHDLFICCSFYITKLIFLQKISQKQAQFSLKLQFFMKIWPQITYFLIYLHKNLKSSVSWWAPSQYSHFIVTNLIHLWKIGQIWSKMDIYIPLVNRISYCTSRLYNRTVADIWQLRSFALI